MKKIRITITMTEEEAAWLEQICFIEEELPWQKFINRVGKTVRRARHAFQQSVQADEGDSYPPVYVFSVRDLSTKKADTKPALHR